MKAIYKNMNIIGSDETGVGDYLTPLVAAAVFVPYQNVKKLEEIGIKDSKELTDTKILALAKEIKSLVVFNVRHLTQQGYNKLNTSYNANELKMLLHMSSINEVEKKVDDANLIIIDQFSTDGSILNYYERLQASSLNVNKFNSEFKLVEKGEREHVAVAAASILAREKFLELMEKQNVEWNTKFPFGTNKRVEAFIVDFVKKHGRDSLNKVAKVKFKTTEKLFS